MTEDESKKQMHYLLDQAYREVKEGEFVIGIFVNLVLKNLCEIKKME